MNIAQKEVKLSRYDEFPVGIGTVYKINEVEIAVFKLSTGEIYAIENKSPHPKGGRLSDGLVSGEYLYCPLHDWKISLKDGKVQAPDKGEVRTFKVEHLNDQVYIYI